MDTDMMPMVLLSRAALVSKARFPAPPRLPITPSGTTFTMAQEASWLDDTHYAVGRWDGSLSIFNFTASAPQGPIIARAVNNPSHEGVQMITPVDGHSAFVSSGDQNTMVIWRTDDGTWSDMTAAATLAFQSDYGVANSGCMALANGKLYFVAGHSNGRVTIWSTDVDVTKWQCVAAVDVRSTRPTNPWGLTNIRGVGPLPGYATEGFVVTGSEDGNLTVIRVPDGKIMSVTVYNANAQRGINSLVTHGETLLVANCAVGDADFNLWSYEIDARSWAITCTDRANLTVNTARPQVFNFDIVLAPVGSGHPYFFCSTEEGALWLGRIQERGKLSIIGHEIVTQELGSALCFKGGKLALTAYDLKEYLFKG